MPKTIGIDARFYGPSGKGLGRYTQEIIHHLLALDKKNRYVIFLSRENFDLLDISPWPNARKVLTDVRWYSLAEQILMPFYIWREKVDLMHFHHFNVPIFTPTKFVVTIHDLILLRFPTVRASTLGPLFYWFKHFAYRLVISLAVRRAQKIIAVSHFTREDILRCFKVPPAKVKAVYEGVSEVFQTQEGRIEEIERQLRRYGVRRPFLLYVGNAYPHKNLERLLKVFVKVYQRHPNLQLVLVGKEDYFYTRLKQYACRLKLWDERGAWAVAFPGYVPDSDLRLFYQEALAYVFPSLYEGFGLPPLEAMAQGCPVLSSN
ncbi:glycosyltransferase family 1 protein, partial [Candidatus Parcubacteria bacterium]